MVIELIRFRPIQFHERGYYKWWFQDKFHRHRLYIDNPYDMSWSDLIRLKFYQSKLYQYVALRYYRSL